MPNARPVAASPRTYVNRLRQSLGSTLGSRIVTRSPGYLLEVTEDEVDLLGFAALCGSGAAAVRSGSWQQASVTLSQALGLWRGTPLIDIPSQFLQRDQVPRLEELRLQALEDRFDADLHLGRHHELIADLQHTADTYPLRERLRALLMIALCRAGRQADALAAFRQGHRVLMDELAVEPGAQLGNLHQQILAGDPALAAPMAIGAAHRIEGDADLGVCPASPESDVGPSQLPQAPDSQPGRRVPGSARQLPLVVWYFTGREREQAKLHGLLHQPTHPSGAPVESSRVVYRPAR